MHRPARTHLPFFDDGRQFLVLNEALRQTSLRLCSTSPHLAAWRCKINGRLLRRSVSTVARALSEHLICDPESINTRLWLSDTSSALPGPQTLSGYLIRSLICLPAAKAAAGLSSVASVTRHSGTKEVRLATSDKRQVPPAATVAALLHAADASVLQV